MTAGTCSPFDRSCRSASSGRGQAGSLFGTGFARPTAERLRIGADLKIVQYGWPVGMPLVRKLSPRLWEVRTHGETSALRVLFTVGGKTMLLSHAFEKTSAKTSRHELAVARRRLAQVWLEDPA